MAKFRPRFWAGEHWWLLVGGRAANDPAPKNAILFRTVSAGTGGAGALDRKSATSARVVAASRTSRFLDKLRLKR